MDTLKLSMTGTGYRYFIEFIRLMYYHGNISSTFVLSEKKIFVHTSFVCHKIQLLVNVFTADFCFYMKKSFFKRKS
jgi:hypothetical protein